MSAESVCARVSGSGRFINVLATKSRITRSWSRRQRTKHKRSIATDFKPAHNTSTDPHKNVPVAVFDSSKEESNDEKKLNETKQSKQHIQKGKNDIERLKAINR